MCRVDWKVDEGDYIENHDGEKSKFLVAIVHGPKSSILKGERIALNVLSRSCGIATEAHVLKQKGFQVAGSRKTTPGFRLVQKYALLVGGADTHRYDTTASLMLKDNHIDALGGNITEAVKRAKQLASFTQTIEVECRSIDDAAEAADAGADIVMLDNFLPNEADLERLSKLNVKIEISGGITPQNIPQNLQNFIFSMGHLTHSAEIIDFSLKINKSE